MAPDQAAVGKGGFDYTFIEPPDRCRVGAPQLAHGVSMKKEAFFGFVYFVYNVWGPAEFEVKENPKILDCVRVLDGGVVKGKGGK